MLKLRCKNHKTPVAARQELRRCGYWPQHSRDGVERWSKKGDNRIYGIARVKRHYDIALAPAEKLDTGTSVICQ